MLMFCAHVHLHQRISHEHCTGADGSIMESGAAATKH